MTSSPTNSWLAFDIGGANIKAADGQGWSHSEPFAMWQEWKRLPDAIRHVQSLRPATHHAVTMTGEIADCFSGRSDGVRHIVQSCCLATGTNNVFFY
ncbi:MAG: tetrahydromethanopterin-linked C1 transfer pathway, partial [Planctomycetaceae bacterium]|nr:tetrahydromethanopterin-linked C1 transfer pathway [Planctomycetaceae bacterium]